MSIASECLVVTRLTTTAEGYYRYSILMGGFYDADYLGKV